MYGEAAALVEMAALAPANATMGAEFQKWVDMSRGVVNGMHWNAATGSFAVIPLAPSAYEGHSRAAVSAAPAAATKASTFPSSSSSPSSSPSPPPSSSSPSSTCNLTEQRPVNTTVPVLELLAYTPWYWSSDVTPLAGGLLVDPKQAGGEEAGTTGATTRASTGSGGANASVAYGGMWARLFDKSTFAGPWGLRSAELSSPCYNYSYTHGDCWNGPSWPYETARVISGAANALHGCCGDGNKGSLSAHNVWELIGSYASQHTRSRAVNDTASPIGSGHVFENLHADLGYWNNRERMYWRSATTENMGNDYFHSTLGCLICTVYSST